MTMFETLSGSAGYHAPRFGWRRILARVLALQTLRRERIDLARFDARMLRDVGLTRADVERTLSRPDEHLALILGRGRDQF